MKRKHGYHQIFREAHGDGPWPCYGCGKPVIDLLIHHLDEDPSNNAIENLTAMHLSCHMRLHRAGKIMPSRPDEHRQRIADALRGKPGHPQSDATRQKISATLRGKPKPPRTDEHRRRLSESMLGKTHSAETKAKMSASHRKAR